MQPMQVLALVGGVLVLLGWLLWFLVRRWNRTKAILQAATPMPIKMVNVWDTVWIRGAAQCAEPLYVPHFGHGCLHYSYTLEEQVTRTKTNSEGKTVTPGLGWCFCFWDSPWSFMACCAINLVSGINGRLWPIMFPDNLH